MALIYIRTNYPNSIICCKAYIYQGRSGFRKKYIGRDEEIKRQKFKRDDFEITRQLQSLTDVKTETK